MLARSLALASTLLAVTAGPVLAASASGEAESVVPAAAASGTGGSRVLEIKGPVLMGDVIKTDAGGMAQLKFVDDTKMVVGPNSQITIDSFVFKGPASAKDFSLDAVRGTFRFITGASAKQAYSINRRSGGGDRG